MRYFSMAMMCFANSFAAALGLANLSAGQQFVCGLIMCCIGLVANGFKSWH